MIEEQGKKDGRIGGQNAWPVDMLQPRDVYVCDHFELKEDGPSIGDNVGNAIYAKSHNGIVYAGAVRDINGLNELDDFVSFVRFYDPSHHFSTIGPRLNSTMIGINTPDPDRQGDGYARRRGSGARWRRAFHSAAAGGTGGEDIRNYSSA